MQISRRIKSLNRSNKTELEVLQMQIKLNKASMLLIKFVSTSSSSASSTSSIVIIKIYLHFEGFHFKTHTRIHTQTGRFYFLSYFYIYYFKFTNYFFNLIWFYSIFTLKVIHTYTRTFLHIFKMSLIWFYFLWIATNYIGKNVGKHLQNHKKLNSFQIRSWDLLIDCIFSNDFVSSISFLITQYFQICFYSSFV